MKDILTNIVEHKREELKVQKASLPIQTIILIDNQLVTASVVQIWFRKKGVYLVTNRTEN
jgi:hypothetical protein